MDDEGNIRETGETNETYCRDCEDEELFSKFEEGPQAERFLNQRISDHYRTHHDFTPEPDLNLMERAMDIYKDTNVSEIARMAMAQLVISSQLYNAQSANSMGKILPNLGFIWVEPSGAGKTPLLIAGVDNFRDTLFKDFLRYETGTAKGMKKSLSKYYKEGESRRYACIITWDEYQDLVIQMRQETLSDTYSFFSQMIDNRLQNYDSVRSGSEKYPYLYTVIWLSGVPEALEKTNKNFWFQGMGTRFLFIVSEGMKIKPIGRQSDDVQNNEKIIEDLKKLNKIRFVEYTDDFLDAYNEYRIGILTEIQKIQQDMSSSQEVENFPVLSRAKYPVLVWKLSIIHAASRGNFSGELLRMDKQDLEEAKKDLEKYNENMLTVFNYWEEHSIKDLEIKSSSKWKNKFHRHFKSLSASGKMSRLEKKTEKKTGINDAVSWVAIPDPSGKWIDEPMFMRYAKMTYDEFEKATTTLTQMGYLVKRDAVGGNRLKAYYKWIDDPQEK
ncbi:MAG: hypothetical protein B2I17_01680 [Thermoplasmatales archaeon B_DKE]|nr:MAG: hypothetical protein B2I17_01680 [Thermoplasmatales archaeon B_DKE]